MKFSAERESLLAALQSVIGVVERRQTMPILANLLLSAEQGKLSVTATDLEVELVASATIKSNVDGRVTVQHHKFGVLACPRLVLDQAGPQLGRLVGDMGEDAVVQPGAEGPLDALDRVGVSGAEPGVD